MRSKFLSSEFPGESQERTHGGGQIWGGTVVPSYLPGFLTWDLSLALSSKRRETEGNKGERAGRSETFIVMIIIVCNLESRTKAGLVKSVQFLPSQPCT